MTIGCDVKLTNDFFCSGLFVPGSIIPSYWIGFFYVIPTPHVVRAILLSQVHSDVSMSQRS
jgi:hypothetical protein